MVRYVLLIGLAVLPGVGCRNIAGPFEARDKPRVDLPQYDIEEQRRRGRDKHALFDDDPRIGPSVGIGAPSPVGR